MDLKQIKQIIDLMKRSELTEFAIEEEGFKLKIRRGNQDAPLMNAGRAAMPIYSLPEGAVAPAPAASGVRPLAAAAVDEPGVTYVKSPMVGTFYRAPTPESKPFVDTDSVVSENTAVCIIEAMKIMNEIQSEVKGTVLEVLAENGQPVEYGQKLFKVRQG
ncbi:MAG TPA: acetyl-CoA carboxylase biotin carboxyl carrier protein [Opitutaceae bacterium]